MSEQKPYKYFINEEEVSKEIFEAFINKFECVRTIKNNEIKSVLLDSFFAENKDKNKLIKKELNNHIKNILDNNWTTTNTCDKANSFKLDDTNMTYLDEIVGDLEEINRPKFFKPKTEKEIMDILSMGQIPAKKETENKGVKYNQDKPQLSLLFKQFPKALEAIARCSEYGHKKYKKTDEDFLNFKRVDGGSKAYADAGLRHRMFKTNTTDIDSQLPHSYHVAWNALAELELILENK